MTGVSTDDFSQIFDDFTRTLSYSVVTKSIDVETGDETSTFATASNITAIFFLEENRFLFNKQGLTEVGDAYIMAKVATGIKRYDRFTVDGNTYYINKVIERYVLGVEMLHYGVCFLVGKS